MQILDINEYAKIQVEDKSVIDQLKSKFTLISKGEKIFVLKLYKEDENNPKILYIPRGVITNKLNVNGAWDSISFNSNIILKDRQIPLFNNFIEAVNNYSYYGGILQAATGVGKTVIAIELIKHYGLKTLIVVPLDRLMKQWKERLLTFTDLKEEDIGIIRGPIFQVDKPVVLAMVHSLVQKQYPEWLKQQFGVVVFDETHVLGCETFSKAAVMFNSKYRIGLSATPTRRDGMDNVFIYHIGKIISKDTKLDRQPKVITLKYSGKNASHLGCIYNGKLSLGKYLNKIYKLSERNMLIAKSIHNAYLKNREILCLSDRISQLHLLKDILIKHCEIAEEDIGLFTSIIKQENKKVILATYGSAGMGVDIPRLDTIIFATPRVHVTQAVGRILRDNYKDKKESIVIDIIDTNSSIMTSWFYSRVKLYKTLKAEIIYGK